jgi:hypothetical protein
MLPKSINTTTTGMLLEQVLPEKIVEMTIARSSLLQSILSKVGSNDERSK